MLGDGSSLDASAIYAMSGPQRSGGCLLGTDSEDLLLARAAVPTGQSPGSSEPARPRRVHVCKVHQDDGRTVGSGGVSVLASELWGAVMYSDIMTPLLRTHPTPGPDWYQFPYGLKPEQAVV